MSLKRSVLFVIGCSFFFMAQRPYEAPAPGPAANQEEAWVDSIYRQMTETERIGQLFMIRAHSDKGPEHIAEVERQIRDYQVGGLCFFQGTPEEQARLTNEYQALTNHLPLLIAQDAEWGLGMRLIGSTVSFPRQLTLGAIQDNRLIYDMGVEVARHCRRLGVHINFAPVADVNNNADNPVINFRSFGENRYNVAVKSYMYMKGMQDNGVIACAKHFPGHGDTDVDSHYDLPVIPHDRERLDSIELFPFRVLVEQGVGSIMVAHLEVPALDSTPNMPTTLSAPTVTDLLQKEMGFEGLIITDGLEMKGVTKHHVPGELEAKALVAGNDILLLPENVDASVEWIRRYLEDGRLSREDFERKVKKVLRAKYRLDLKGYQPVDLNNLREDLNHSKAIALKRKLLQNALTLVRNRDQVVPFKGMDTLELASICLGTNVETAFQFRLKDYADMPHFQLGESISAREQRRVLDAVQGKDAVIVGLHNLSPYASRDYGFSADMLSFLEAINREARVILVVFGSPYTLKYFDDFEHVLVAYTGDILAQDIAAQALFGAFSIKGRLPVTASPRSQYNMGEVTSSLFRLGYGIPEEVGLNSEKLKKIDTIAWNAIDSGATPGCVVLVAKDGKIIFEKGYGSHTYSERMAVQKDDIYDLASITKVAATTLAIMKLQDQERLNIYDTLYQYLPETDTTDKRGMLISEVMAHRAGLIPWIPFYLETLTRRKKPLPTVYQKRPNAEFSIPVAEDLYILNTYPDTMWKRILDSELRRDKAYRYSDLGFYLLAEVVKRLTGQRLDVFVEEQFYRPLGLRSLTFNPLDKHDKSRIPPTEEDRYFRWQRLQGHVHDMGAAMLGGVSGHAGLFGNAQDVAALMQMLLNKGYYAGEWHLNPLTVRLFTNRCGTCKRRGIGFDMKQMDEKIVLNMSSKASPSTFGHLGFTGTCTWADPEHNLVYVFLSNRTYPSMSNNLLGKMDIRPRIQTAVYEAMEPGVVPVLSGQDPDNDKKQKYQTKSGIFPTD